MHGESTLNEGKNLLITFLLQKHLIIKLLASLLDMLQWDILAPKISWCQNFLILKQESERKHLVTKKSKNLVLLSEVDVMFTVDSVWER